MILASASPRRRELLSQIGVSFKVEAADIDETPYLFEAPRDYVERMARQKAAVIAQRYPEHAVLGADTSVIVRVLSNSSDGCKNDEVETSQQILGKPQSDSEAHTMLSLLSNTTHQVISAVALQKDNVCEVISVTTDVTFRPLSVAEIQRYIATGEPKDKAGGYAIQGLGAIFIEHINGSYSNVVGLPLTETAALLQRFNIPVWNTEN